MELTTNNSDDRFKEMREKFDTSKQNVKNVYSSYLDKDITQYCTLYMGTYQPCADKRGHPRQNVSLLAMALDIQVEHDRFQKQLIYLIFPLKSFLSMLKKAGINNPIELCVNNTLLTIDFVALGKKERTHYQIQRLS